MLLCPSLCVRRLRTPFPRVCASSLQPGTRVLVPFRKKSMVGVVVELVEQPPANTKLREITKVMEFAPALTPKLIELAQWIANYYLAPVGEVFRAMLPPVTELNLRREIVLTGAGRGAAESLGGGELSHGLSGVEAAFLEKANAKKGPVLFSLAAKMGISAAGSAAIAAAWVDRNSGEFAGHEKKIANDCCVERICGQDRQNTERKRRKSAGSCLKRNAGRCRCRN